MPQKDTWFITTAIDYTNGPPHIGHAYEKLLADVLARYQRSRGKKVFFLTGVDQHGQKVQQSAEQHGVTPREFADENTARFVSLWKKLGISYDGWAATTDPLHGRIVQRILQSLFDEDHLYKASHRGFYSVRQEQFITGKEQDENGNFGPEWGEVVELEEENWYFRLSRHVPWLKEFVRSHPGFVFPSFRGKELLNALENTDAVDLCISRPKSRLSWGIEIPFDTGFVTYVWFDALINYISFAGYLHGDPGESPGGSLPDFGELWPANAHVIGKDIMVPAHAVYWPIMLHAMGFRDDEMPRLLVHGFWNDKRGEKFSKSEGNIIDPALRIERFGVDAVRYYLMASIATGQDADFNDDRIAATYETALANDLGNLLNRTLNMSQRYHGGKVIVDSPYDDELNRALRAQCLELPGAIEEHMRAHQVHLALEEIWKLITSCNQYVDKCAPWKLAKEDEQAARLESVLHHLVEALAHVAVHVAPVMPGASRSLLGQLQLDLPEPCLLSDLTWGMIGDGHQLGVPAPMFPRLENAPEKG